MAALDPEGMAALAEAMRDMEMSEDAARRDVDRALFDSAETYGTDPSAAVLFDSLESVGSEDDVPFTLRAAALPRDTLEVHDVEDAIAEAFGPVFQSSSEDDSREGATLETVIPYDFDPARDSIVVEIPRGFGPSSGKTLEITCARFVPSAAVAIPVPSHIVTTASSDASSEPTSRESSFRSARGVVDVDSASGSEVASPSRSLRGSVDGGSRPIPFREVSGRLATVAQLKPGLGAGPGAGSLRSLRSLHEDGGGDEGDRGENRREELEATVVIKEETGRPVPSSLRRASETRTSPKAISPKAASRIPRRRWWAFGGDEGWSARVWRAMPSLVHRGDASRVEVTDTAPDPETESDPERRRSLDSSVFVPRADSFSGMVQSADASVASNGFGGRAHRVVACHGLVFEEGEETLDGIDRVGANAGSGPGANDLKVVPRWSFDGEERGESRHGGDPPRAGCAVDEKNLPGVAFLDDRPFARGGFAKVYRGAYENPEEGSVAVAIKTMTYRAREGDLTATGLVSGSDAAGPPSPSRRRSSRSRDLDLAKVAREEAELIHGLHHANVVACVMHHTGKLEEDGEETASRGFARWRTVIVTEFCAGGALSQVLRHPELVAQSKRVRNFAAIKCIAGQIVAGMTYLHARGIVHGDLKASNVLLHPDPSRRRPSRWMVKIADFGTACVLPPDCDAVVRRNVNGTISHMAPELLKDKLASRALDVYAFAMVLWEMAAQGARAFAGITLVNIIVAVVRHDLRPRFPLVTHDPLRALASRCWRANPHERPDFEEIASDVKAWRVDNAEMPTQLAQTRALASSATGANRRWSSVEREDAESDVSSEMPLSTGSIRSMEANAARMNAGMGLGPASPTVGAVGDRRKPSKYQTTWISLHRAGEEIRTGPMKSLSSNGRLDAMAIRWTEEEREEK
jgi:serine/threonine protein kinase